MKKVLFITIVAIMLCICISVPIFASENEAIAVNADTEVLKNGLIHDEDGEIRYYKNGIPTYAGVVTDGNGNYYYINSSLTAVKNTSRMVRSDMTNGLISPHYTYHFDENGVITNPAPAGYNGLLGNYYLINGTRVGSYYGLVEHDGDYYLIDDYAMIVKGRSKYVANTRGLCYPDGTPIPQGTFYFDNDGKMQYQDKNGNVKNGLIEENGELYYYRDGVIYPGAGLIWTGSFSYYYINSSGKAIRNVTRTVVYGKTNGLLPEGTYTFGADGRMIDPPDKPEEPEPLNGFVWLAGDLIYYVDNEPRGVGVVFADGYYYYFGPTWFASRNETVYIPEKYTNGLLPSGQYSFDDQCRMILN